jgi:hypothetical protein
MFWDDREVVAEAVRIFKETFGEACGVEGGR